MTRSSSKPRILRSTVQVIERDGLEGLTLDAVAREAGLTKGGVQYHFASKDALIEAVERQTWDEADQAVRAELHKDFDSASPDERLAAYIKSTAEARVQKVDIVLALANPTSNLSEEQRTAFEARWTGEPERKLTTAQHLAILAADGLALRAAFGEEFSAELRAQLISAMLELAEV